MRARMASASSDAMDPSIQTVWRIPIEPVTVDEQIERVGQREVREGDRGEESIEGPVRHADDRRPT